ncbi:uncharacterized protein KY384_001361 [Bacidia gigantensis]|uniref:uncharacterized protein n=1 Tax=Bacidia gigantensis TaxID=2732470 RepID=UPI001D046C7A|nr:uncharacterized protein KY384_001361 [Bacidia gigantensis]KAG8533621.1 hypothetical protein KY384_001361 [Bacidia gigantensis]
MDKQRVEFHTFDSVTLRGDFFPARGSKRPIVVMTQGVCDRTTPLSSSHLIITQLTLLKEHYICDWAARFQAANFAALTYDHRGWGSSDGTPRNEVDPYQQAEDYHDAVLFAQTLPNVDKNKVIIWGIGHSGGASMIAAGDDPNIHAVILCMPFNSGKLDSTLYPPGLIEKTWLERAAQSAGTKTEETTYIQPWDRSSEECEGPRNEILIHGPQAFSFIKEAERRSRAEGTPWENKLTLESLYKISRVEPRDHIGKIAPRKLLYLAAREDPLSGPIGKQRECFERAGEPKRFVTLETDHVSCYFGEWFEKNIGVQIEFLGSL